MVVLYLDLDCFYVQAELCRRPELRGKPVVIQQVQNGGFIAISYEARAAQIKRGDGIGTKEPRSVDACLKRCPNLQIVPVDMPHNRYISQEVEKLLRSFSSNVVIERNSIDDFCLDCHKEIENRLANKVSLGETIEEEYTVNFVVTSASNETPLSSIPVTLPATKDRWKLPSQCQSLSEKALAGCYLAREIQLYIHKSMQITSSIGISESRIISRLIVSMNKPFKLTLFPSYESLDNFLQAFPLTRVHGLRGINGAAIAERLKKLFGEDPSLLHLQRLSEHDLCQLFGNRTGMLLSKIRFGQDYAKIEDRGPPKSILVELSFDSMTQTIEIYRMLRQLSEDLLHRIIENTRRYHRRIPTKITIRWRRGPELSTGSQVFSAPKTLYSLCHEAADQIDKIPSTLNYFGPALDSILAQGMNILLKALSKYPSTRLTGNRDLNRIGVVASSFVSNQNMLKTVASDTVNTHLEESGGVVRKDRADATMNLKEAATPGGKPDGMLDSSVCTEKRDSPREASTTPYDTQLPAIISTITIEESTSEEEAPEDKLKVMEINSPEASLSIGENRSASMNVAREFPINSSTPIESGGRIEFPSDRSISATEHACPITQEVSHKGDIPTSTQMLENSWEPHNVYNILSSSASEAEKTPDRRQAEVSEVLPDCWKPQLPSSIDANTTSEQLAVSHNKLPRLGKRLPAIDLSLTSSEATKAKRMEEGVGPPATPLNHLKAPSPPFSSPSATKRLRRHTLGNQGPAKKSKVSEKQLTLTTLWGKDKEPSK